MKYILLVGLMVMMAGKSWGQVKVHQIIDRFTGDTSLETEDDTLSVLQLSKKHTEVIDKVSARLSQKGTNIFCRLFIGFQAQSTFSVSNKNIAYFETSEDSIIAIPNYGDYNVYTTGDHLSFLLDISKYINFLKNAEIKEVRLTLSPGLHTIPLEGRFRKKIADIITALLNYH